MRRTTGLDVEWAYGLIRQESRFIINARSEVGAGGLMQLMPGTAQLVAKKIGLGPISRAQMNDINTNILLGTNYLSMIYNQFDNSAVLATAGYNAGPGPSAQVAAAICSVRSKARFLLKRFRSPRRATTSRTCCRTRSTTRRCSKAVRNR